MDNLWNLDRYFGAKERHTQTITIDTVSKEDYLSSLSYVEIIELITKQYMDIEIFGSLDRKRKVLDYISVTRLKPEHLLSCEYVLRLEKYKGEDEFEV